MSTYKTFAFVGAGNLGVPIVQAFAAHPGISIVVLRRTGGSTSRAIPPSAKSVEVDYADKAAVAAALREHNVEVVVSTVGAAGLPGQTILADAAKEAGVKLFVPSEFGMVTEGLKDGLLAYKTGLIDHLKSIGLPYTRYYNGFFAEYTPWVFAVAESKKFFVVGKGETPISFTSISDVAGYVAHTLTTLPPAELANATLRIQGTRATPNEVGALYGGKVPVEHVDAVPSDVPQHEVRTFLQSKAGEGAGSTGWDNIAGKESGEAAGSGNKLWPGHQWKSLKEVLSL